MKYKSFLALALTAIATLGLFSSAIAETTIVSWGGNYFNSGTSDLNMIGSREVAVSTGTLIPFSETIEISPNSTRYSTTGTSYRFYGTTLLTTLDGTGGGTPQVRVVLNNGQNRIHINSLSGSATNLANAQGMFAWKKEDFLNGANSSEKIALSSLGNMSVSVPNARGDATIRFAIQNDGVWYLSESSLTGNKFGTALGTLSLSDLASSTWGVWNPTATATGLNAPPTVFDITANQLTNITAVGFWFNATYAGGNAAILDFESFSVTTIPEPGTVAFLGLAGAIFAILLLNPSRLRQDSKL